MTTAGPSDPDPAAPAPAAGSPGRVGPPPPLDRRASGLLLHLTSLPGPYGIGDLGPAAFRFAGFLARAAQRWWQMLPVEPPGFGDSPYNALSAFAGSPWLVSLERLAEDGLLDPADLAAPADLPADRVDYARARAFKVPRLRRAAAAFPRLAPPGLREAFEAFCRAEAWWLEDYALYAALKAAHGERSWTAWPAELRTRDPQALARARRELADVVDGERVLQFLFADQWAALRAHCRRLGVALLGDLPLYVAPDSADVWAHQALFRLDAGGEPEVVAGVPPDYFSATGQRWGTPLYRWDVLASDGYRWWLARLRHALARFDAVRLDHFIGFVRYWEIPAGDPDARGGRWVEGPGAALFEAAAAALGPLPLVAEDLGSLTPEVTALRERFGFPGMQVLQFLLSDADDLEAVRRIPVNTVVYTGTHDNDTAVGWFRSGGTDPTRTPPAERARRRRRLRRLLGPGREVHWTLIRLAWESPAVLAIAPVQDLLGLGPTARMNRPATEHGNWAWRLVAGALTGALADRLAALTRATGRA